jgi:TetR/AcrR family transcriptional regulator, regulator of cefoperazone and chloramphenicol sensitivity
MTTRSYHSTVRANRAKKTRAAILKAAQRLFTETGFSATTITEIADRAGCSPGTVYVLFASKAGILASLVEAVAFGEPYRHAVQTQTEIDDPATKLRSAAHIARLIYESESQMFALLRGAGFVSAELAHWERALEERRYDRQKPLIRYLAGRKALAPGVSMERTRERLWALTSRELYRHLVVERGWSSAEYETWLGDLLVSNLLTPGALEVKRGRRPKR